MSSSWTIDHHWRSDRKASGRRGVSVAITDAKDGLFRVRQQLTTVPGTLLPTPYSGVACQIMVDLDQNAMLAKGVTPIDVTAAINAQNVTLPSGTAKVGTREYTVSTNSSPIDALMLNNVPVKTVNGSLVYMQTWRM